MKAKYNIGDEFIKKNVRNYFPIKIDHIIESSVETMYICSKYFCYSEKELDEQFERK